MNILNVNMSLDPVTGGGTAERTFQMSHALVKLGLKCSILTLNFNTNQTQVRRLGETEVIAIPCLSRRFYIPRLPVKLIRSMVKNADIIHLMNHWTLVNAVVYFFARHLGRSYVVCPAGALPIFGRSRIIKKAYNWIVGRRLIHNASALIAISVNELDHFRDYGVNPEKVTLIPNGVSQEEFQEIDDNAFRLKHGLKSNPFILFLGRLNSIKGPDLLLNAFLQIKDRFPDLHLVYAGPDGGLLSNLNAVVRNSKSQNRVHFIGHVDGAEKSQAYHAADLVVIPSRQEAMSIVVLEAGISGTPVLITDQCGFDEVEHIGGGKVVSATIEGLSNGLVELLSVPEKLKTMGRHLKNHASKNYTWNDTAERYLKLYQELLSVNR
jgi:glycosyltransferase involved in cell wall biosynthesis